MVHEVFYLIEPRPELATNLRGRTDPDFADILTETLLIRDRQGDRSTWKAEDHAAKIKLLFLARLREYDRLASDTDATRLLGSDRIGVEVFDRWWVVRPVEVEGDAEELSTFLRLVLGKVTPTGKPLVDDWLASVRDLA